MHVPERHQPPSREAMIEVIRSYPLATVVRHIEGELVADHVPMVLASNESLLRGHVARNNAMSQERPTDPVLAIFNGPSSYVSPSWCPSKLEDPAIVPTWNYVVVHVKGELQQRSEASWLFEHLVSLTTQSEYSVHEQWVVTDAPAEYREKLLKGIVGIEIKVSELLGKWKTAIVRPEENLNSITSALRKIQSSKMCEMANWIEQRSKKKF